MSLSQIKSIITYRQWREPNNPSKGDVWLNTRTEKVKTWNGSSWDVNWSGYGGFGYTLAGHNGSVMISSVCRILFPFDSGTGYHIGNLSMSKYSNSACNSSQYGFSINGDISARGTQIERIQFPFNSGIASIVSENSIIQIYSGSYNSSKYGFIIGGENGSSTRLTYISRFLFPFDSGNVSVAGNINQSKHFISGCNSSIHGFSLAGGYTASSGYEYSNIERIQFPFDSGNATSLGYISHYSLNGESCNSSTHGFNIGGYSVTNGPTYYSSIDRISFPFDSGNSSKISNLSNAMQSSCCNSDKYGYSMGGGGSSRFSNINRIQFPFDSGNAVSVGNLSLSVYSTASTDETDFVSIFV